MPEPRASKWWDSKWWDGVLLALPLALLLLVAWERGWNAAVQPEPLIHTSLSDSGFLYWGPILVLLAWQRLVGASREAQTWLCWALILVMAGPMLPAVIAYAARYSATCWSLAATAAAMVVLVALRRVVLPPGPPRN